MAVINSLAFFLYTTHSLAWKTIYVCQYGTIVVCYNVMKDTGDVWWKKTIIVVCNKVKSFMVYHRDIQRLRNKRKESSHWGKIWMYNADVCKKMCWQLWPQKSGNTQSRVCILTVQASVAEHSLLVNNVLPAMTKCLQFVKKQLPHLEDAVCHRLEIVLPEISISEMVQPRTYTREETKSK